MPEESEIRLALPGKGALESATLTFLAECGMKVNRSNSRQYLARISSMPNLEVVFQRAADTPLLVQDGDAALGITGYDILAEHRGYSNDQSDADDDDDELMVLEPDLGYGQCRLVVAVPETWIDVSTCADLWHLAGYYSTHKNRPLRIATKYPLMTGQFLRRHGITHCKIITPHGALEAAPLTKTADLIVDLTETGTTLRENHLKLLDDGTVLHSQACLIANAHLLRRHEQAMRVASTMLELIEARMQARNRSLLTAHIYVASPQEMQRVSARLSQRLKSLAMGFEFQIASIDGASKREISASDAPMQEPHAHGPCEYTLSGVVNVKRSASELLEIVEVLRSAGAAHINITPLTYRFAEESASVRGLRERLKRIR